MPITIERSNESDRAAILRLMDQARGKDLSEAERAREGFVQGQMDEASLARMQAGLGVFVARDGASIAGFCMTSTPGTTTGGPPGEMINALARAMPALTRDRFFLYGPVAIARQYQGQGLLTRLLIGVCAELRSRFALGALFVETANEKSLAVHRHYPMKETACFVLNERSYVVFTFSPDDVVKYYQRAGA